MAKYVPVIRLIPLATGAAVFATICDGVHAYTGTLSYSDPMIFGQPWTVFPSFFVVFVFMMVLYDRLFSKLPAAFSKEQSLSAGRVPQCIESFTLFVLVYLMSGVGHEFSAALNIIFYGAFLVRWLFTYDRMFILVFAIVLGIGGMAGEGFLVVAGLVEYIYADIFHVPYWLGGVYLHGALALREVMRAFAYKTQ